MPVKYKIIGKRNPRNPQEALKYYPSLNSIGRVTLRNLTHKISLRSTLTSIDMMAANEALLTGIAEMLLEGYIVDLGDFGTFSLKIRGIASDSPKKVTAHKIKGVAVNFKPGQYFKQQLSRITYQQDGD